MFATLLLAPLNRLVELLIPLPEIPAKLPLQSQNPMATLVQTRSKLRQDHIFSLSIPPTCRESIVISKQSRRNQINREFRSLHRDLRAYEHRHDTLIAHIRDLTVRLEAQISAQTRDHQTRHVLTASSSSGSISSVSSEEDGLVITPRMSHILESSHLGKSKLDGASKGEDDTLRSVGAATEHLS
ncbi:MAG: hypothetical protein TREMPRED_003981 [Tremellales sp. Tagirdzhanova-0007]|nr:MAG: hypothetical protein TREMPRED_003981 [Tremellales sp. Tagirdzhanova-0007]